MNDKIGYVYPDIEHYRGIREEEGYSQRDMAEEMGISRQVYSRRERKISRFTLTEAYFLARLFDKSIEELFFPNQ